MTVLLRLRELYAPTLKEDPTDAELASHRLLTRAAMIRKTGSGFYSFLPLGYRVLHKIEAIVREEMDAIGAQEIMMPILQPAELWLESGRWEKYGPELMRVTDRHGHEYALGPTHEELITDLVRHELRSYKQLPVSLYQIQMKYRDEIRPRFGLLRSREFLMKDAYSFHSSDESLQETYDAMSRAYGTICDRCDLEWRAVEADSGQIGGNVSTEFMALADSGEAELVYCECGYSADTEAAVCLARPQVFEAAELLRIETPGIHAIEELAEFLKIEAAQTVKALAGIDETDTITVLFVPGDHELNAIKAEKTLPGFRLLSDEELLEAGLVKGSMGPVGLPEGIHVIADQSLEALPTWVVGANEDGYHLVGAAPGRDFTVDAWADLCTAQAGDSCPLCGAPLELARGIEVSQVFQLGTKYSEALGATFADEDGVERPFIMGCYGVGVSRTLAAVVEQHHDDAGIIWPVNVAPAHVCVIPLTVGDDLVGPAAERLAQDLAALGLEVAIDDRSERAGVKFADADLIGWPLQIIIGKRGLANETVEIKLRRTGERRDISLTVLTETMAFVRRNLSKRRFAQGGFDQLFR